MDNHGAFAKLISTCIFRSATSHLHKPTCRRFVLEVDPHLHTHIYICIIMYIYNYVYIYIIMYIYIYTHYTCRTTPAYTHVVLVIERRFFVPASMHLHLNTWVNKIYKYLHTCMYTCVSHILDAQVETCQTRKVTMLLLLLLLMMMMMTVMVVVL